MKLKHEPGIIIHATAKRGRERDPADIEIMGGQKAGAALKQIERGIQRNPRILRQRADLGEGGVGIAGDLKKAFDHLFGVLGQPRPDTQRRLFEKAVCNLVDRPSAHRGQAGNR